MTETKKSARAVEREDGQARVGEVGRLATVVEQAFDRLDAQGQENARLREELARLRASRSYRIGRKLARLVRATERGRRTPSLNQEAPPPLPTSAHQVPEALAPRRTAVPEGALPIAVFQRSYEVAGRRRAHFRVEAMCMSKTPRSGLLQVTFTGTTGEKVMPTGSGPAHPVLGEYHYVPDGVEGPASVTLEIEIPPNASTVHLQGHQWKKDAETYLTAVSHEQVRDEEIGSPESSTTLESFIASIPDEAELVVIISTAPPLGHATLALRPNRLAREYSDLGRYVIYVPFGSLGGFPAQQSDRIRQVEGSRLTEVLELTSGRTGRGTTFVCSSYPDVRSALLLDRVTGRGWNFVYEVRDEMEEFNRAGYSKWFRPQLESFVAKRADVVVTVSPRLAEKMDILRGSRSSVVVPNGVEAELADRTRLLREPDLRRGDDRRQKVGYIGHLTPSWFDWESVIGAALVHSDRDFEIVGHGCPDHLDLPRNVTVLGPRTHDECIEIVDEWAVGLIPFRPTPLTSAVDPNKLYEYLAFGVKTVSMAMGSVDTAPLTWVYEHPRDLGVTLEKALSHIVTSEDRDGVERYLARSTWTRRAESMLGIFRGADVHED